VGSEKLISHSRSKRSPCSLKSDFVFGGAAIPRTAVIAKKGSGTVNLLSGSLEIEGNWKSACSIYEDGEMHIEGGMLIWRGDRRADFNELVASHKISWTNGGAMRFDSWDHSYTNGDTVLYSYRAAETANKTVVWATSIPTLLYNDWADSYSLSGPSADLTANPDNDDLDNLLEYALGGNPSLGNDAGKLPTFLPDVAATPTLNPSPTAFPPKPKPGSS
jgi:hypothetical protein